jgi:hypothetical protein
MGGRHTAPPGWHIDRINHNPDVMLVKVATVFSTDH